MTSTEETTPTDDTPTVDERDPATLIPAAVEEIMQLAATWLAWDGAPIVGDGNVWTPVKALRRITDHLLDHLAEIEAVLAGAPTVPDTWLGRTVTLDSDWARFTEGDLNEAGNRLRRYAELYRVRIAGLPAAELDLPRTSAWTVRQIAHHVAGVTYYAHQVGDLTVRSAELGSGPARQARRHHEVLSGRPGGDEGGETVEDAVDAEVERVVALGRPGRLREGGQDLRVAVRVGGQGAADLTGQLRFEIVLAGRRHLDQAAHVAVEQRHRVESLGAGEAGARQRRERVLEPGHLVRAGGPGARGGVDGPRMLAVAGEDRRRPQPQDGPPPLVAGPARRPVLRRLGRRFGGVAEGGVDH
jgi:hypothetical protein